MKTTPHGPNLLQLTRLGMVNAYLVREDDGFTLVDTGLPRLGQGHPRGGRRGRARPSGASR